MVNILFISNNAKLLPLIKIFQERVKVKLDVANDFDLGLKEVFEKRPALVFIQDQIAGVAGESVARHIQMLLGSSAPQFILLHDGVQKLKPVKTLYEFLLDVSSPESKLLAELQNLLQHLLGAHWEKIYVPPATARSSSQLHEASPATGREVTDQLVDDLLSDLNTAVSTPRINEEFLQDFSDQSTQDQFNIVSSPHDQLAEMLSESAKSTPPVSTPPPADTFHGEFSWEVPGEAPPTPDNSGAVQDDRSRALPSDTQTISSPTGVTSAGNVNEATSSAASESVSATITGPALNAQTPTQLSPADFFIEKESPLSSASAAKLPDSFRVTYDSSKNNTRSLLVVIAIVVICVGAIWWLYSRGIITTPTAVSSYFRGRQTVASRATPQQGKNGVPGVSSAGMPTFVPIAGHDPSFSSGKPGWERYSGANFEVRLFRQEGRLKAVQVIAAPERTISEQLVRSILYELVGEGSFREGSQELKHGFQVSHATAVRNTEMLIYRKQKLIHAVVISLE